MLLAQISDLHVAADDAPLRQFIDTNAQVSHAVERLNSLSVAPDLVLATGDLVDKGTVEEYETLRDLLAPLEHPLRLIPGNHDDGDTLAQVFAADGYLPAKAPISYVIDDLAVRIVMFDSTDPALHDGVFPEDRAEWLDATLGADDRPTIVAMHHPPFDTGIFFMDVTVMHDRDRFREVIGRHPHVVRVLCGHIHRSISTQWGPTTLSICPSTAHAIGLDLDPEAPPLLTGEPSGFQLHRWTGDQLLTHTVPLEVPRSYDISQDFSVPWPEMRQKLIDNPISPKNPNL